MEKKRKLGEIFVERGILTEKTVERMLLLSKRLNKRFGAVVEELGLVEGHELAAALAAQYSCRVASNFAGYPFPPELLAMVPVEVAVQNHIFPLKLDSNRLALAMADPTETRVVKNIAADRGLSITPFIATRAEIDAAICKHYLHRDHGATESATIVVAEDDKLISTMFRDYLSRHGYRVVLANNGFDAFKAVLTEKPRLVITDLVMPKMDGYGLFDAMRSDADLKRIPVILIAATLDGDSELKAFEKGFFDIMQKPVREATLIARVKRALKFHESNFYMA